MTLFWTTRDRTGRDFKHLLGCAAFLEQLAERKLHPLQGIVVCLWFIPLAVSEGRICFLQNWAGQGWWGKLVSSKWGNGGVLLVFWVCVRGPPHSFRFREFRMPLPVWLGPLSLHCVTLEEESTHGGFSFRKLTAAVSNEVENQGENMRVEGVYPSAHP